MNNETSKDIHLSPHLPRSQANIGSDEKCRKEWKRAI